MKFSGYTLETQAIIYSIYSLFFSLHNCTFKSKAIYYIAPKSDNSVKASRLCNNCTYPFFNRKPEPICIKSYLYLRHHWTRMRKWWRNGMLVLHHYLRNRLKYIIFQIKCFPTFSVMVLKTPQNVLFTVKIVEQFVWCSFWHLKLTSFTVMLQKTSAATYSRTFLKAHSVFDFIIILHSNLVKKTVLLSQNINS